MELHGARLFRTAALITRDHGLAQDAVQETFVRAWRNLESFRRGTNLRAWLTRILVNYISNQRRRKQPPQVELDAAMQVRSPDAGPEQSLVAGEVRDALLSGIASLPVEQRIAVVLRFYGGYSVPEIAEATGWREGTVKSRLHRAMRALRDGLSGTAVQGAAQQGEA